jgi:autophagy-related protein 33
MAARTVSTLKFVGSISVGLLTGLSYTLSTLALPSLLTLPSATTASRAFSSITTISLIHLRILSGLSSTSFLLAYILSPRSHKHPYLLWTSFFIASSSLTDIFLPSTAPQPLSTQTASTRKVDRKGKGRQMDASYDVLGVSDRESEEEIDEDDEVNGEEVRVQMEGFRLGQLIRTAVAGVGFAMSVVGIWGDGASDLVIIEM